MKKPDLLAVAPDWKPYLLNVASDRDPIVFIQVSRLCNKLKTCLKYVVYVMSLSKRIKFQFASSHPLPLFHVFLVFFKQTIQILQQINVKNVHPVACAGIQTLDLLFISLLLQSLDQGLRSCCHKRFVGQNTLIYRMLLDYRLQCLMHILILKLRGVITFGKETHLLEVSSSPCTGY